MIDDGNPKTNSENPLAAYDLTAAVRAFRLDIERGLEVCFPACIYSYDRSSHTATVMPLVKMGYFYNQWYYMRRGVFSVSVRNIQCGGITIDIPLFVGDTGWVISSDRDTMLLKQHGSLTNSVLAHDRPIAMVENDYQTEPNRPTLHTLSQGFFIPDNWGAWQHHRYKDNPTISVGNACYIGSSFDTEDENKKDVGQKGDEYEKKSTSSIVVQPSGGVFMASSVEEEQKQSCLVEASGKTAAISATDMKENKMSSITVDAQEGVIIRQDDEESQSSLVCSFKPDSFMMRFYQEEHSVAISIEQGQLCIGATDDVMIRTEKNVMVNCAEADVNCTGDVNVSAGGAANVKGDKGVNVNSCDFVNVASAKSINMTALDKVNLVTGGEIEIMSKKESSKIEITTLSKESEIKIATEGEAANLSLSTQSKEANINISTAGESSSMTLSTESEKSQIIIQTEGESSEMMLSTQSSESSITLDTYGESSSIKLSTTGDNSELSLQTFGQSSRMDLATFGSSSDIEIYPRDANVNVSSSKMVNVSAPLIELQGEVEVQGKLSTQGSMTLNGKSFSPSTDSKGHQHWAWS